MITRRRFHAQIALAACLAARMRAQDDPAEALLENQRQLTGDLTLDRPDYLAGEAMQITIRIRNPTNRDLLVPVPFLPRTGYVEMARRLAGGLVQPLVQRDDYGMSHLAPPPPTVTFAAGSEQVRTIRSQETALSTGRMLVEFNSAPAEPGPYSVFYHYVGVSAPFRVIVPTLEKLAEVKLRRQQVLEPDPDDAAPERVFLDLYRAAFAVRHENVSHLCVCYLDDNTPFSATHLFGRALDDLGANQLSPYRRIASNPAATASIAIRETALDDLEIIWTDVNGAQRVFVVKHTTLDPV